jgi:hypothetical protein
MKNFATALQKGNLTPKERVLIIVQNEVEERKTGKTILSEAEKHSLSEGWTPANNNEVGEYNRFIDGWRIEGFAELDAQSAFMDAQTNYFQEKQASNFLLLYPLFRDTKGWVERLNDIKLVNINQALEVVKKQREVKLKDGLEFDRAVYQLAFESLGKEFQEDLETLFPEVKYETDYLDEEEIIASLFSGKEKLTTEDKNKLADLIIKKSYNQYAKEYQFFHYFASIPIKDIVKRWMKKRGVKPETLPEDERFQKAFAKASEEKKLNPEEAIIDWTAENIAETVSDYAGKHRTTVEAELKEVCLEWLEEGMLDDYEPLFKSPDTETCNGVTKLPSNVIFKEWIKAKARAKRTLDNLVSEGKLKREGDTLTGDSLYNFKGDYQFIKEHNEHVDRYDANLGIVYADNDPDHKGVHLDRELLVTEVDENGKPCGISFYQMAMARVKGYFKEMGFVKETVTDKERVIEFEEEVYSDLMISTTEGLKHYYSILLKFRELFEKLSKIYEIDLTDKIDNYIARTEKFIDDHNWILEQTIKKGFDEMRTKKVVRFKEDWFIDKTKIEPDKEEVAVYFKKLEEELGEDF